MNNSNAIELKQLHQFLPEITPKQKDCLLLWMLGLSIQSIAAENGVCEKTVRRHLDDARNSMGGAPLSSLRAILLLRIFSRMVK